MKIRIIRVRGKSRNAILSAIADRAAAFKISSSKTKLLEELIKRENEGTTAFEKGLAILHARLPEIQQAGIIAARNDRGVEWNALDGKKTDCAIALLIPAGASAGDQHMKYLAALAGLLLEPCNVAVFKKRTSSQIEALLEAAVVKGDAIGKAYVDTSVPVTSASGASRYDFVAVNACPTGVAHKNASTKAFERFARKNGPRGKVERQKAQGTVSPLIADGMGMTHNVILAIGRNIEDLGRFAGRRLYRGVRADRPCSWCHRPGWHERLSLGLFLFDGVLGHLCHDGSHFYFHWVHFSKPGRDSPGTAERSALKQRGLWSRLKGPKVAKA